ncbi:MAG: V-type ATP synthase subunit E [Methanolinea sp.]|nr:V-type ATP synthase subunit E [Methanolinea sp.]
MTYEDLLQSMEAGAREKITEIDENARRQSDDIIRDAEERAGAIQREIMAQAMAAVADKRNRSLYKVRQDEKAADIQQKEEIVNQVFQEAAARLKEFRTSGEYPLLFSRLLREALHDMGQEKAIVHVDPRDEPLCQEALRGLSGNHQVVPDLTTWGGVVVSSPDEKVRIHNTLESRLERARLLSKKDVCHILFGD